MATQPVREQHHRVDIAALPALVRHEQTRGVGTFQQLKSTLSKGDSDLTPVLLIALAYALWGPTFLLMLGLAELAYHFG